MSSAKESISGDSSAATRIVLLDGDQKAARQIAQVLRAAVDRLEVVDAIDAVEPSEDKRLLVVNYDMLSTDDCARVFDNAAASDAAYRVLLYTASNERSTFAELFGRLGLMNLLAKSPEVDGEELLVTMQKLLRNDIFGIEKYFPWGVSTKTMAITASTQRDEAIDALRAYALEMNVIPRLAELYASVGDELITNALYNSPVKDDGSPLYAHYPRTKEVELASDQQILVTMCRDGRRLGISVADPFGSIRVSQVLDYLAKCFRGGEKQVDDKEGGAGLGLYYVFESLSHFVVNLASGRRTEMIGLLDVRGSYRDFASRGKSFNVFVEEP